MVNAKNELLGILSFRGPKSIWLMVLWWVFGLDDEHNGLDCGVVSVGISSQRKWIQEAIEKSEGGAVQEDDSFDILTKIE